MLLFKKRFLDAIRSGRKSQTVRVWRRCRMKAGQKSYIPGVGYIRINAVDRVELDELTDEDAALDGFDTAELLRAEIRQLYPEPQSSEWQTYRIRFRLMTPEEAAEAKASRRKYPRKRSAAE